MIQAALVLLGLLAVNQPVPASIDAALSGRVDSATQKALDYLVTSQSADGGWEMGGKSHPAISALVIRALAQDPRFGPKHPAVRSGLEFVLQYAQPDGGIYREEDGHKNYHTSVALLMLSALQDPAHKEAISRAQDYLKKLQWDEGEGHEVSSPWYGGQGYGRNKRPDLSNTQLMIEALHDSGLSPEDPAYKKALVFIERCQMLDATNDQSFADGADDGGFVYTPANGGESMAGTETSAGRPRLRSYGSMTYAAFKSMIYADVQRDDPRVRAALEWISRHYTLEENPNMPGAKSREGLFYYYYVFARALQAWGEPTLKDASGVPHHWRNELAAKLLSLQRPDGSWVNDADRWYESNPYLVTSYAVLALQAATTQPL
jgi:squalene-hopene/tetraprenyl-beta-curcumene cyclase